MKKRYKYGSLALFIVLLTLFANTDTFALLRQGEFSSIAASEGIWILLLLTLILMLIQNIFTVIPLILLISFNVTLFGFAYGYIWSWFTSVIGALISFWIVRYWFQDFFIHKLSEKMKKKIENNGFTYVFIGRIFPFVPTSLINIAAGVSSINLKQYTISTLIGNMIYMFVLALIPLGIMSIDVEFYVYVVAAVMIIIAAFFYKIIKKKQADRSA